MPTGHDDSLNTLRTAAGQPFPRDNTLAIKITMPNTKFNA